MNAYKKISTVIMIVVVVLGILNIILQINNIHYDENYIILPQLSLIFIQVICVIFNSLEMRKETKEFFEYIEAEYNDTNRKYE